MPLSPKVQIAVLDDHLMFLDGLSLMVQGAGKDYEVSGFSEPLELLKKIESGDRWNLIICDLIMNQMNGLAFVAAVCSRVKNIPILMLSGINTTPPIDEIRRLGAKGFVHKSSDNTVLLTAIETILSGKSYFLPDSDAPAQSSPIDTQPAAGAQLTDDNILPSLGARQLEVLRMIAKGASNKEISRLLSISENTVKTHLRQIFLELGVNKRTACVQRAQTLGII